MAGVKHEIAAGNLTIHKDAVLGSGGAGNVYKGSLRTVGGLKDVAVKELDVKPDELAGQPHEYNLLRKALEKCQWVCRPLGYCVKDQKTCLVLKLYEKSLEVHLQEQRGACLYRFQTQVIRC